VRRIKGRKNPMPNFAPVAAYASMLGPSFSPSITRIPGPTSNPSNRATDKTPRSDRAFTTRERSRARSTSSWVMTISSFGAGLVFTGRGLEVPSILRLFGRIAYTLQHRKPRILRESRVRRCEPAQHKFRSARRFNHARVPTIRAQPRSHNPRRRIHLLAHALSIRRRPPQSPAAAGAVR
jgi:hypothetical protein